MLIFKTRCEVNIDIICFSYQLPNMVRDWYTTFVITEYIMVCVLWSGYMHWKWEFINQSMYKTVFIKQHLLKKSHFDNIKNIYRIQYKQLENQSDLECKARLFLESILNKIQNSCCCYYHSICIRKSNYQFNGKE